MPEPSSPLGAWRLTVRQLGGSPTTNEGEVDVLAQLNGGGGLTVVLAGRTGDPGLGIWSGAGPDRLVLVAQWFVTDEAGRTGGLRVVRAAVELSADARLCWVRLLGRRFAPDSRQLHPAVSGEAVGVRIEP
jgi:hypothetical protein